MKRSGPLKRKTPLARESKRRKLLRSLCAPTKVDFLADVGQCMICDNVPAEEQHEIARGNSRERSLLRPRLQMGLGHNLKCKCHERCGDYADIPPARQLALRLLWELRRTVQEYNDVRDRPQTAQDVAEVWEWMKRDFPA